ncbi:hypothetical protein WL14_10320 [Burkholderia cepacia]|nr:hypothetical protein WJ46_26515 [Burkholderia cepacia]KVQ26029.1 hypothetical protein WK02_25900 [Burkholderia cepacia]KVZ25648.1 hypothetical protein WL14_10320 [Burkholderia cepacia]
MLLQLGIEGLISVYPPYRNVSSRTIASLHELAYRQQFFQDFLFDIRCAHAEFDSSFFSLSETFEYAIYV